MTEEDKTRIEAKAKLLDMWKGIKVLKDFEGTANNFWFAHPIGFISHLARMGALDQTFNPYEGYSYKFDTDLQRRSNYPMEPKADTATSNPGFAPMVDKGDYTNAPLYNGVYYAECTSPYGIRRFGSDFRHSGIDFGTRRKSQPIISFIYGEVWACIRDVNDFGNVMIIKDLNEPKVYFLAHIADNGFLKTEGKRFEPGEKVAMAGGTGGNYHIHLHLEVFLTDATEKEKALVTANLTMKNRNDFLGELVNKRVDPFNHDINTHVV